MFSRANPPPGIEPWIVSDLEPSYLRLGLAEIEDRAREALGLLGEERCVVCPRLCKVGRLHDERGLCAIGRQAVVASHFPHFGEENCLRGWNGSGTIFFSGCNLRCVFCVAPETRIATSRGVTPIEQIFEESSDEITLGEGFVRRPSEWFVHTVDGQLAPVSKAFRHHHRGELVRVKSLSGPEIRVTPNHGVFTARRSEPEAIFQIPAGELTTEHFLVIPKRAVGCSPIDLDLAAIASSEPAPQARRRDRRVEAGRLVTALESVSTSAQVGRELGYHPALRMNVLPSIHLWRPAPQKTIEGRRVRQSPLWFVKFKRDRVEGRDLGRERSRWKDAGTHFLVPIHRIERERYDGPVYNLEVDHPTHSYLAPAVAIGNCQNHSISWEVQGERVNPVRLAEMMLEVQAWGCHNVNFVTPEHVVPQILEALPHAVAGGLRLPIVYNTSSYDSLESLESMDGIVDVYMPDFKVWTAEAGRRYLRRPDYAEVARQTVKEMNRQVGPLVFDQSGLARRGVLLRHLVMPGMLDETEAILRFVHEELGPDTYVDLMAQYYPAGLVGKPGRESYEEIDRHLWREEYLQTVEMGRALGLRRLDPRSVASADVLEPSARSS